MKLRYFGAFFVYLSEAVNFTNVKFIPSSKYESIYDQERFRATWSVNLFVLFSMTLLSVFEGIEGSSLFQITFIGCLLALVNILVMLYLRTFKITAFSYAVMGMGLLSYVILTDFSMLHYTNFAWMISIIVFVFFALGRIAGVIVLVISMIVITVFVHLNMNHVLENVRQLTDLQMYNMSITYILAGSTIVYIINKFITVYLRSEERVIEMNHKLIQQNEVVQNKNNQNVLMLKEIHHRVKNNLQIVSSMLRLQSKEIESEELKRYFDDAVNRVSVMALVHEKMYQNNLEKIEPKEYFEALAKSIRGTYNSEKEINVNVDIVIEKIGLNTLVPLALIVNELMTNSIKYAFENCLRPSIDIRITQINNKYYELIFKDNGAWNNDLTNEHSFGLEMVEALIEQLDGEGSRSVNSGTVYTIRFANQDK